MKRLSRRNWLALTLAAGRGGSARAADRGASAAPLRIFGITFRGKTDVEKGFEDHFAARRIPVRIDWRDLDRDTRRLPGLVDEIRATRPDLVYAWGTSVTLGVVGTFDGVKAGVHITDIPVVFTLVAAPVSARIVPGLASSGRNVTGVTHVTPTAAQIRAIQAYRPLRSLGVLYTPTERNSVVIVEELRHLGRELGFALIERTFRVDASGKPMAEGAAGLVREIHGQGAQWLYLPPDSFLGTQAEGVIVPAAMAVGLPTFASTEQLMQAGALCGLVCRYYGIGQFTAHKAEQILVERRPPQSLPIETLSRFSYQISMQAAHRLQLPPPLAMMNYAEVIRSPRA